jgi:tetratricopeptide (TPR) repeat protein
MTHLDDDVLLGYLHSHVEVDRAAVESHLGDCPDCSARVAELRPVRDALKRFVHATDLLRTLRSFAAAEERERAGVPQLAREFEILRRSDWLQNPTHGLGRELLAVARYCLDHDPEGALEAADVAVGVAGSLSPDAHPRGVIHRLRGDVQIERANALTILDRFWEALAALDEAALEYRQNLACSLDLAVVDLTRAGLLVRMGRLDDVQQILEACSGVFLDHGETMRFASARLVSAYAYLEQGSTGRAATVLQSVEAALEGAGDREIIARVRAWMAPFVRVVEEQASFGCFSTARARSLVRPPV